MLPAARSPCGQPVCELARVEAGHQSACLEPGGRQVLPEGCQLSLHGLVSPPILLWAMGMGQHGGAAAVRGTLWAAHRAGRQQRCSAVHARPTAANTQEQPDLPARRSAETDACCPPDPLPAAGTCGRDGKLDGSKPRALTHCPTHQLLCVMHSGIHEAVTSHCAGDAVNQCFKPSASHSPMIVL